MRQTYFGVPKGTYISQVSEIAHREYPFGAQCAIEALHPNRILFETDARTLRLANESKPSVSFYLHRNATMGSTAIAPTI